MQKYDTPPTSPYALYLDFLVSYMLRPGPGGGREGWPARAPKSQGPTPDMYAVRIFSFLCTCIAKISRLCASVTQSIGPCREIVTPPFQSADSFLATAYQRLRGDDEATERQPPPACLLATRTSESAAQFDLRSIARSPHSHRMFLLSP